MTTFVFRRTDTIGAAGAEEDDFLRDCFVDTGDLDLLSDVSDKRLIVLGRTGSGKSALLETLEHRFPEHVIRVSPESLALTYVSNSTILQFFSGLGVNLDPFFKLLWRHVLSVELLTRYFDDWEVEEKKGLLDRLRDMFTGETRADRDARRAIEYLKKWGSDDFWLETEARVKEVTNKLERDLDAQVNAQTGAPFADLGVGFSASNRLSEEQRTELKTRGQRIVSQAQIQDLDKILSLLDTVLDDPQKHYYVLIDRLDENWVEETLRYKLIMALILTAREFLSVANSKIIIALRRDLIERVFRLTRESGFQEEKYQSLYLPLEWEPREILEVLDKRVRALVKSRYTGQLVSYKDLLPRKFNKAPISEYICERAPRPRDVIALFNSCIAAGQGKPKLNASLFRKAEGEYSRSRLKALGDEWSADYPSLLEFSQLVRGRSASFKAKNIGYGAVEDLCLNVAIKHAGQPGLLRQTARKFVDGIISFEEVRLEILRVFYRVGLCGLKVFPDEAPSWVGEHGRSVSRAEIGSDTIVAVHPTYHRALGIRSG